MYREIPLLYNVNIAVDVHVCCWIKWCCPTTSSSMLCFLTRLMGVETGITWLQTLIMDKLNVLSLNAKSLLSWLKEKHPDIILLQESHITEKDRSEWAKDWNGDYIKWWGDKKGGSAFSSAKSLNIKRPKNSEMRKADVWDIRVEYILSTYYGPNNDDTGPVNELLETIDELENPNINLGGGLQFCLWC